MVKDSFLNNNYFSHPEHVLLALIADKDKSKRELGVKWIREARRTYTPGEIRRFAKPKEEHINFEAEDYSEILKFDKIEGNASLKLK